MQDGRVKNSVRNSLWGTIGKIVALLGPFFFRAIIIRYIGAQYIGLNGLFKSILSVLNMTELGFSASIVFMMYKPIAKGNKEEVRQLLSLMRKIYKVVGIIILVAGCAVFPFLKYLVKNDTGTDVNIYLLYGMYLFHTAMSYLMFSYRTTIFTANQRSDILSKITLTFEIIMYVLQALALIFTKNYYIYLAIYAVMVVPQSLSYYFISKKKFPEYYCEGKPTKEHIKTLKGKIIPLMGHRIGGKVIVSIDDIVISAFLGVTFLTQYDNYYYIFSSIVGILTVVRNGIIASMGNKLYSDSLDNTYKAYRQLVFIWIFLVGWCSACLAGLYQPFIGLWLGEKYVYDTFIMLSIVLYFFVWQFRYIGVTMKDSAGLWEPDMWKPYIGMVLNLVLSIVVVKLTGSVLGVLYPTMFVMLFIYFPWETYVLFKHLFKRSAKDYLLLVLRCVVTSGIAVVVTFFVGRLIGEGSILRFAFRVVVCGAVAAATLILTNINLKELKGARNIALNLVRRKKS